MSKRKCWVVDCGEVPYDDILVWQKKIVALRMKNIIPDVLLLAEHNPVISLGNGASESELRIPRRVLEQRGVPVRNVQRDGGAIFYMPGQVSGYAIRSLGIGQNTAHQAGMEETMIRTLADYKINARKGYEATSDNKRVPGVWALFKGKECKLGSIGIDIFQRISMHGFTLNINTRNEYFDFLELHGRGATSIQRMLDRPVRIQEVKEKLIDNFAKMFDYSVEKKSYLSFLDAMKKVNASVSDE